MDTVHLVALGVTLSGWKILGLSGALCFAARWLVQVWYRHRTGSARIPTVFWVMSVVGASLSLLYFIFGKNDSVGILQNVMPLGLAGYNLWKDLVQPGATG